MEKQSMENMKDDLQPGPFLDLPDWTKMEDIDVRKIENAKMEPTVRENVRTINSPSFS